MDDSKSRFAIGDSYKAISQIASKFESSEIGRTIEHFRMFKESPVGRLISDLGMVRQAIPGMAYSVPPSNVLGAHADLSKDLFRNFSQIRELVTPFNALPKEFLSRASGINPVLGEFQSSPLFEYFASLPRESLGRAVSIEGDAAIRIRATGEGRVSTAEREQQTELEHSIVALLRQGGDPALLPSREQNYLAQFWIALWDLLEKLTLLFALWQAYEYVEQKLTGATTAEEVRKVIREELSAAEREVLAEYRVVIIDGLRLRSDASKDSTVLGLMRIGTMLDVIHFNGNWAFVSAEIDGETVHGWVYTSHTAPFKKKSDHYEVDE